MHTQPQVTAPNRLSRNNYRTTARIVGVLYLAGMVVGIGGNLFIQSILGTPDNLSAVAANTTLLAMGAVLWLSTVAGDAAHGISVVDRQGVQHLISAPIRADHLNNNIRRHATPRGQRYSVTLDVVKTRRVTQHHHQLREITNEINHERLTALPGR